MPLISNIHGDSYFLVPIYGICEDLECVGFLRSSASVDFDPVEVCHNSSARARVLNGDLNRLQKVPILVHQCADRFCQGRRWLGVAWPKATKPMAAAMCFRPL